MRENRYCGRSSIIFRIPDLRIVERNLVPFIALARAPMDALDGDLPDGTLFNKMSPEMHWSLRVGSLLQRHVNNDAL